MSHSHRNATLQSSLKASVNSDGTLHVWRFIYNWFRDSGRSYYFVFKKNLDVTNVQFAELLALVKRHAYNLERDSDSCRLHFYKMTEFAHTLGQLAAAFPDCDWVEEITARYSRFFESIAVLDLFRGSCGVYLPPGIGIRLEGVCADSGYIHSCGWSVFSMTIDDAAVPEMTATLRGHIERKHPTGTVPFRLYAREDFSEEDERKYADEMRHGLADLQLRIEKYYIGRKPLADYVESLKSEEYLKDRLRVCRGDDSAEQETDTMWLLVDRAVDSTSPGAPIGKPYFICYDQLLKNESTLQVFDENKPAWIDHVTLPHSLACAMLNLAVPEQTVHELSICDPFVGSGTVLLEATKFVKPTVNASDCDEAMPVVIRDNVAVFLADSNLLTTIYKSLDRFDEDPTPWEHAYRLATEFREGRATWKVVVGALPTWQQRMPFYVWLRVIIRHAAALRRGTQRNREAWRVEVNKLTTQLRTLIEIKGMPDVKTDGGYRVCRSMYSLGVSPHFDFAALGDGSPGVRVGKAEDLLGSDSRKYDAIVTDPPYGFNTPTTDDSDRLLADLYRDVIPLLVNRLNDNGSLVMCLPERAYTKRQSPFFVTAKFVTHQVLAAAVDYGKEVVRPSHIIPAGFRPPYYWESERALRRAVLVFRFRDRGIPGSGKDA